MSTASGAPLDALSFLRPNDKTLCNEDPPTTGAHGVAGANGSDPRPAGAGAGALVGSDAGASEQDADRREKDNLRRKTYSEEAAVVATPGWNWRVGLRVENPSRS